MSKKSFVMYSNWAEMLAELPDEQAGILIKAISSYALGKDFSIDDPVISAVFTMIRSKLDEDRSKYDEKVERITKMNESKRNRDDIDTKSTRDRDDIDTKSKRNRDDIVGVTDTVTVNDTVNDTVTVNDTGILSTENTKHPPYPPQRGRRFSPPAPEEVAAYCEEHGYAVDPEEFVDFYTSKGWKVGKNPMKDWRAAVRTWARRDRASPHEKPKEESTDDYLLRRIRELEAEEAAT